MAETAPVERERYPMWIALALLGTTVFVIFPVTITGGWVAGEMYDTSVGFDPESDALASTGLKYGSVVLAFVVSLGLIKGTYAGVDWLRSRR